MPGLLGYAAPDAAAGAVGRRPRRSAFCVGWLAGLGYFVIGAWWVAEAFLVDEDQGWMAPFALVLMAGGLALFWGAAALALSALRPARPGASWSSPPCFALLEWLRGHVLTGFPWNLAGRDLGGRVGALAGRRGGRGLWAGLGHPGLAAAPRAAGRADPAPWRRRGIAAGRGRGAGRPLSLGGAARLAGAPAPTLAGRA